MMLRIVDRVLERTGHRPQRKYFVAAFLVSQDKHAVLIVVPVPGNLIEVAFCHVWRFGQHIAAAFFFILYKALQKLDRFRALGHQSGKP